MRLDSRRIVDVTVASAALVVATVPMLFAYTAVRLTMGKPAIFRQQRYGLNGKIFTMYKLRTMSNEYGANGQLLPIQSRLTGVGKILRRTAIDEIPQLFNILKGDMSLYGPRPEEVWKAPDSHHHMHLQPEDWEKRRAICPGLIPPSVITTIPSENETFLVDRLKHDLAYLAMRQSGYAWRHDIYLTWVAAREIFSGAHDHASRRPSRRSRIGREHIAP